MRPIRQPRRCAHIRASVEGHTATVGASKSLDMLHNLSRGFDAVLGGQGQHQNPVGCLNVVIEAS
jgi:hypothetical protein